MITLNDIEKALRPNFVFMGDAERKHVLETSPKIEGNSVVAIIVFIGIAYFEGYKKIDIIHYLGIKKHEFDNYLAKFIQAYNENAFSEVSELYNEPTPNKKLIAKYKIVSNALKIKPPVEQFFSLDELNF